jgi:hypothetical protein
MNLDNAAMLRIRVAVTLVLGLSALLAVGCYKPEIPDGAFVCGTGNTCPDGFQCSGSRCYKNKPSDGRSVRLPERRWRFCMFRRSGSGWRGFTPSP